MRVAFRHFLLDSEGTLYRLAAAALYRMFQDPDSHRLPRFAAQRVRSAEIAVTLLNGNSVAVERCVFSLLMFTENGALVSPLSDRHLRARAELALALGGPNRGTVVEDAGTRFLARGGEWSPSPAVRQQIEQIALGRLKCGRLNAT